MFVEAAWLKQVNEFPRRRLSHEGHRNLIMGIFIADLSLQYVEI